MYGQLGVIRGEPYFSVGLIPFGMLSYMVVFCAQLFNKIIPLH